MSRHITIEGDGNVRSVKYQDDLIGHAIMEEAGQFMYQPSGSGLIPGWILIEIGELLAEINRPWNEYLEYSFGKMERGEEYLSWKEWSSSRN